MEKTFSIHQMMKILHYMGVNYYSIINSRENDGNCEKYKEGTSILAYYVIRSVLLCYADDFIEWCGIHNKKNIFQFECNKKTIQSFLYFIKDRYKDAFFLNNIQMMEKTNIFSNKLKNSTRMTVCEKIMFV
jgi:hypothetical protein